MRVDEWEFADAAHPVYERAPQETRWPAALPRMIPDEYMDIEGQTVEPLHMSMEGYPSIDLYKGPGGSTIQKAILRTAQDMRDVDLTEIERIAEEWLKHLRTMSLGPYSLKTLREMGHPYGFGERGEPPSWQRLKRPRAIPRAVGRQAIRPNFRQPAPDRAFINLQSGDLYRSWHKMQLQWYGGLNLLWLNSTRQAWWLAHGTYRMQAHGPWATVAEELLPRLHKAWRRATYRAWRAQARRMRQETAALEGQFGMGAGLPTPEADAGGFS